MPKITFTSNNPDSLVREGKPDPLIMEVEIQNDEVLFDIGRMDQIDQLTSGCIYLTREDAMELGGGYLII